MMFDWNDRYQAGGTIWGEFSENEDHIVPYPKGTKENPLFTFGDYNKKQRNGEAGAFVSPTEQTTGYTSDFRASDLENSTTFNTNEKLSAPRLDMDPWPDLPALSTTFKNGYTDNSYQDSMAIKLVNDFQEAPNLSKERVQLAGEPDLFSNVHEDKENTCFLDCDWANIGDLDLDRIFTNDPIFGHNMAGNRDEFPSPSTDVVNSTAQSIPMPDLPLNRDEFSDQDCSSFHFKKHSGGKRKSEEKTADSSMRTGDQIVCQTHLSHEFQGTNNQFTEKDDKQKKPLKPWKRVKEKNKNERSQNPNCAWSPNIHASATFPTFQSPTISQQEQFGNVEPMRHLGSFNQPMFVGKGNSTSHLSGFPLVPCSHAGMNQIKPITDGHKINPDPVKHSNYVPDVLSRRLTMTPQEKIEKLRRRQQMQAMLAIQQQQHKFSHQIAVTNNLVSHKCSPKDQSHDPIEHDESQISPLIDDPYLEETIYYELKDALIKLDPRIKLVIRDSLCRLARSAAERQSSSDRNSTNRAAEETSNQNRCTGAPGAETYTNPIDRTVAHLLFDRPSDHCSRQDSVLRSTTSCNTAPKVTPATREVKSVGPEDFEEMEVLPSVRN